MKKSINLFFLTLTFSSCISVAAENGKADELTNQWENPERFRRLLTEHKQAILESKYFKQNADCPVVLDKIINNEVTYLKPTAKLHTQEELSRYVNTHYGCANFKMDILTIHLSEHHAVQYETEAPYFIYDMPVDGNKKYFSVFPFGYQNFGIAETSEIDYEGITSPSHSIYISDEKCQESGGVGIYKKGDMYPDVMGGIAYEKKYQYITYKAGLRRMMYLDFYILSYEIENGRNKLYCPATVDIQGDK